MTAPVERVRVELGARGYDIVVGAALLRRAAGHFAALGLRRRVFVIADPTVARLHGESLHEGLRGAAREVVAIAGPDGEGEKSWARLGEILEAILDRRPERADLVVALGGGIVGDVAGLAASLLLRGVDFVQVPTTLLAQVDSSVGGKTGVNTRHGKNLVGAFYQPRLVLADLDTLATLPRRELLAGYAEVVKYGLIDDPAFFDWLERNGGSIVAGDASARQHAVVTSCRAKARVVAGDERESGDRALLNLGHTFGHALEALAGYDDRLIHGEAVAIGMVCAFDLSARLGLCPPGDAARLRRHLAAVGLPVVPPPSLEWTADRMMDYIAQDKKASGGRVTFILARGIGRSFVARDVEPAAVREFLNGARAA